MLTRSVALINSSRFLRFILHRRKFLLLVKAMISHHCLPVNFCTMTWFRLRSSLCRETAPVPFCNICYNIEIQPFIKFVLFRLRLSAFKCTMMAKTAPCFAPFGLRKILPNSYNPADVLRSAQQRLLMLTAGPLAFMAGATRSRSI